MQDREEWFLAYLGSQHKCIEQPVQPLFSDYLSISYDYGGTAFPMELNLKTE